VGGAPSSIFHYRSSAPNLSSLKYIETILKFWQNFSMGKASKRNQQRQMGGAHAFAKVPTRSLRPASPHASPPKTALSAAIIQLIEPYEHEATTFRMYTVLVKLATVAWNLTALAEAEREAQIAEIVHKFETLDGVAVQEIIQTLSQRKNILFPHEKRLILDCQPTMTPNGYRVIATSASFA